MAAISETLRQARLRSGVDLDKLAAKTKINPRYLEAIENGDFDKLPSGIFARMFIKQYADAVGLDGASFAEEFQRSSQFGEDSAPAFGAIVESRTSFHPTVPGLSSVRDGARGDWFTSMLSSLIWVVAAILVCAGAYYGLAHLPSRSVSNRAVETVRQPSAKSTAPPSAPAAGNAPAVSNPQVPATTPSAAPGTTSAAAPNPVVPSVAPDTASPASTTIQLALSATEEAWVTAIADGKTVIAEILPAGSSKIIVATKGARLTLGNAGGVDITFNGKKLEPFGPKGQVRTVDFTPWGAQVVSRTPPPIPDPL
jgi:cytoskeletal protein RodZ